MKSPFKKPETLLKELGISQPEEIEVEMIAQYCGATIVTEPLHGCEGRIVGYGDKAIITVNRRSPEARRRFSGAHELGHWMRDRRSISSFKCTKDQFSSQWDNNNPEKRANRYAADLLLPDFLFRSDVANMSITFESVIALAERYKTSLLATALRTVELGSWPSMIIFNQVRKGRWKWFRRSPDVPSSIWPHDRPGRDTIAADLLNGSEHKEGSHEVAASGWINHSSADRHYLIENSRRFGPDVLTLLWWEDEDQLIDLLGQKA